MSKACIGTGLGRKAAIALVDAAFNQLQLKSLIGVVDPAHSGSIRLLRKLGFRKRGDVNTGVEAWQVGHLDYRLSVRAHRERSQGDHE